jgi:hypothetical protein
MISQRMTLRRLPSCSGLQPLADDQGLSYDTLVINCYSISPSSKTLFRIGRFTIDGCGPVDTIYAITMEEVEAGRRDLAIL